MSLFAGPGGNKSKPQFTGLAVQTSTSAIPIGLWYGKNRGAGNIIWQGDFKATKQRQRGKGGGGKAGGETYTYSGSYQVGLCWGPINNITRVWKDNSNVTDYASLGFSLFLGTNPQAPWGYLVSAHPSQALGYPDIAYLSVQNYDLGQSNAFPQHSFEVEALLHGTGVGGTVEDADPALIIEDFLSNPTYGVGFNTSVLSNLMSTVDAPTTGDSAFQTYCRAMGFSMSPFLSSQQQAGEIIQRWASLCNSALVWTGYSLKLYPYGSEQVTANGVTYLPDFPVRYSLSDSDYLYETGSDPIKFNRTDPADAFNAFSIIISNASNEYNELPVTWRDQGLIDQNPVGILADESMDAREITSAEVASIMVTFMGQRKAYIRNTFEFKLGPSFCLLEPMDILECHDPRFGRFYVLIQELVEQDDDTLSIVAEEYPASISTNTSTVVQPISNTPINAEVSPGSVNPPIIFEPPAQLTSGVPQVWAAVSGGNGTTFNPNWGGAYVWISTDDVTYTRVGEVTDPARQGVLTASLPNYSSPNPDNTNTLRVNLSMSGAELEDASSSSDAEAGVTLSYVGGELISYEDVTLTSAFNYDIINLWRGQSGSSRSAHSSGADFARLDDAIFKYSLPPEYVGVLLYIKFQSYNIFGRAVEDISTVTAYTFTPSGSTAVIDAPGALTLVSNLRTQPDSSRILELVGTIASASEGPFLSGYEVEVATSPFSTWTPAGIFGKDATSFSFLSPLPSTDYRMRVRAIPSAPLMQPSSWVTSATVTTQSIPTTLATFGFAFQRTISSIEASSRFAFFDTPVEWTIPSGYANSQASIVGNTTTAPTASTTFDVQYPVGTSIGTFNFAASALTATFSGAGAVIPAGAIVTIVAPANLNGMAGTLTLTIAGTK